MMKMAQTSIPSRWPTELQYFCGAGLLVPTPGTHTIQSFLTRGGKGVYPWLAMLRDHLTDTDAYQPSRLRTAERPTSLIFMNGWCSLIYKNGCELPTFAYCIHLTFGEESMAAPLTYGAVQGL